MASYSSSGFSTSAFSTSAFDFDVAVVATAEIPSAGNIDWLKRRKKQVKIKRSEYSSIEEYREAVARAAAALAAESMPMEAVSSATGEVIGDDFLEDDEILLMALTRILH